MHPTETTPPIGSPPPLRLVAWELTRSCNLACAHCRASAERGPYPGELSDPAVARAPVGNRVLLLAHHHPHGGRAAAAGRRLYDRPARHGPGPEDGAGHQRNASRTPDRPSAHRGRDSPDLHLHRRHRTSARTMTLRGVAGAFSGALFGIENAKREGLSFQINTTVTRSATSPSLPRSRTLAARLGADAHHLFLLVPTGRGAEDRAGDSLGAEEYEEVLGRIYRYETSAPYPVKVTCAPQYMRIRRETASREGTVLRDGGHGFAASTRGCLGGISFLFYLARRNDPALRIPRGNRRQRHPRPRSGISGNGPRYSAA